MKSKSWTKKIVIGIIFLFLGANIVPLINSVKADTVWDATLMVNEPGGQYDDVVFGEASDAYNSLSPDSYDLAKPPAPMPPYIRAYLKDNLPDPYNSLWKDYRQYPATQKTWNLTIQWAPEDGESPTTITLTWSTADVHNSEYTSVNFCTDTGTILQNMLLDSTYTFSCPAYVPQNFKIICSISVNQPPVFGTPTPTNGSSNNPLSLSWGIPINDLKGDLFSWTIQCSNGQTNSETDVTNGTKTLALSGLAYSTTYKVWVNATDPAGSGLYTRAWYIFTTKASNQPPVFGTPTPTNGSSNNPLTLSWGIPISDTEGNQFNWTIQCSNGQTNKGSNAGNGTKSLVLSSLANSIKYTVWVNATDPTGSGLYTRKWYTFITSASQPVITISASPNILWPSNHKMKNVLITGSVTSQGVGIASITFTVDDEYNLVEPTLTSFGQTIQLEAWRNDNDMDGRTYTITVTVTDTQGHAYTASTIVRVPHDLESNNNDQGNNHQNDQGNQHQNDQRQYLQSPFATFNAPLSFLFWPNRLY